MDIIEMNNKNNGMRLHRALVLQGGGALGAYEVALSCLFKDPLV